VVALALDVGATSLPRSHDHASPLHRLGIDEEKFASSTDTMRGLELT